MTHVFVVDDITFKYHLEYMFAGTGAGEKMCPFLKNADVQMHHFTERNLVSMIADISRVKKGDNIIFYLQATAYHDGMFFGVFKAVSNAFFDENNKKNYLKYYLGKGLSFRVLIKPYNVFQFGITERELLDNISDKTRPYHLCWSLIYRKLKGNRGCTMIMDYEFEDLRNKLIARNAGKILQANNYTYNASMNAIVESDISYQYNGRKKSLDIEPRMIIKARRRNAFETHLQAFIIQRITSNCVEPLKMLGINPYLSFWVGNEVACGVGMQRIDILIIQEVDNNVKIIPIELKDEEPTEGIFNQLALYENWILQYVKPNYVDQGKDVQIMPLIISAYTNNVDFINKLTSNYFSYIAFNNEFLFKRIK